MESVGDGVRSRRTFVVEALVKHPWFLVSRLLLATVTVAVPKVVPQPWSAGVHPVSLIVAMLLFSRASARS
ncbi:MULTISPECIES: hypothetical protein [Streptomyces]|uniref:Uncharacterized protein n=1 Tax=Streptomyces flaveolus TaxID=67297 RepID=A0ABV1VSV3_9ACTN